MSFVLISPLFGTFSKELSSSIGVVTYEICKAAKQAGVEPYVFARQSQREPYDWQRVFLLEYPAIPSSGPRSWQWRARRKLFHWTDHRDPAYAQLIARTIARNNLQRFPMIVNGSVETAIYLRRKFPKAFLAYWCHGNLNCAPPLREKLAAAVDVGIGVSDFTSRWMQEYFGFPPNKVATIYNAVDSSIFYPATVPSVARDAPPVINYVGRVARPKGLDLLLQAALQLARTTHRFQIQIVGGDQWEGPSAARYRSELQSIFAELEQLGIEVHQAGHVSRAQVPQLLRNAEINVVPTRCDEAFGLSTIEGMACGLATVASRTGGTPEVVGDAALLFERDNVDELAYYLASLLQDEQLRCEYSQRALLCARHYSPERLWKRLREVVPI